MHIPFQNVCVDEVLPGLAHGAAVGDVGHVQVEEYPAEHVGHAHLEKAREGVVAPVHLWTWVSLLVVLIAVVSRIMSRFSGRCSSFDARSGKRNLLSVLFDVLIDA